jgi:CBS domain-containing protein
MDGGRLLRAVMALVLPYPRATSVAVWIGQGIAILLVLVGLGGYALLPGVTPVWLFIIGAFIFFGAESEERLVRTRVALANCVVADVMNRHFVTLAPGDSCEHAQQLIYQTGQDGFPVVDGDRLLGVVTRPEILKWRGSVSAILETDVPLVGPGEPLAKIHDDVFSEGWGGLPVVAEGRLVGWLTPENINRFLAVQRGVAGRKPALPPVIATVRPVAPPSPPAESAPPTAPA